MKAEDIMAEREGFEPSVEILSLRRFSKPLPSATRPPLHVTMLGLGHIRSYGGQRREVGSPPTRRDLTSGSREGTRDWAYV